MTSFVKVIPLTTKGQSNLRSRESPWSMVALRTRWTLQRCKNDPFIAVIILHCYTNIWQLNFSGGGRLWWGWGGDDRVKVRDIRWKVMLGCTIWWRWMVTWRTTVGCHKVLARWPLDEKWWQGNERVRAEKSTVLWWEVVTWLKVKGNVGGDKRMGDSDEIMMPLECQLTNLKNKVYKESCILLTGKPSAPSSPWGPGRPGLPCNHMK